MRNVFLLLSIFILSSCSLSSLEKESQDNPYSDFYQRVKEANLSSFQKSVLEDNKITKSEYDEAHQRFSDCVREQGGEVELEESYGIYQYITYSDHDDYDNRIYPLCAPETIEHIAAIYNDQTINPERVPYDELTVKCLLENDVVRSPFTTQDLAYINDLISIEVIFDEKTQTYNDSEEDVQKSVDPVTQNIVDNPKFSLCESNPSFYLYE